MCGSSPRVRGTPPTATSITAPERFIPARAGNTIKKPGQQHALTVHPRACGEHCPGFLIIIFSMRFIPARAGNTTVVIPPTRFFAVHPRACGEHTSLIPLIYQRFSGTRGSTGYIEPSEQRAPRFQIVKERPILLQQAETIRVWRHQVRLVSADSRRASRSQIRLRCWCAKP